MQISILINVYLNYSLSIFVELSFFIFSHLLTGSSAQPVVVAGWPGRPGLDLGHHSQNRHEHHRQQHRQYYHHHRHHHQHYHYHYLRTCSGGIRGWEPRVGQACRLDMTQLLLLGKFEYTRGPIFKVVLEC